MRIEMEAVSIPNNKGINKPNEDFVLYDEEIGCAVLLDGVSRDKENGIYPNPSPSLEVSKIFAEFYMKKIMEYFRKGVPISVSLIRSIIKEGNRKIFDYNQILKHSFPAGTVGIIVNVFENKVIYSYIGDCNGLIIRNSMTESFTQKQTTLVTVNKKNLTTKEIRYEICNNINHPYGYGVLDGNERAMDFVVTGEFTMGVNDVILLYTDGAEPAMEANTTEQCIKESIHYLIRTKDITTGRERLNCDDQSLIRIILKK